MLYLIIILFTKDGDKFSIRYFKKLELVDFVGFYLILTPVEVATMLNDVLYYSLNQNVKPRNRIFEVIMTIIIRIIYGRYTEHYNKSCYKHAVY